MTHDDNHSALIIVPTMGRHDLVLPCVQRLLTCTQVDRWRLMLVVNPLPQALADGSIEALQQQVSALVQMANSTSQQHVELQWVQLPGPVGWAGAVNVGVQAALQHGGLPPSVVVMNDDLRVTPSWLHRMHSALTSPDIKLQGEVAGYGLKAPAHPVAGYGRIGMVGPVSNVVAGMQQVRAPDVKMPTGSAFVADADAMLDQFAGTYAEQNGWTPMAASFLSGLCVLYDRECLLQLLEQHEGRPCLVRPQYGIGGYDDNDIAARVQLLGWRMAIATNCYVHHLGHQTLDAVFPEAQRGLANLPTYLRTWENYTNREQRLVAVWRVKLHVPNDLAMLRASLGRTAQLVDGMAILLTGNPADITTSDEWRPGMMPPAEQALVDACRGATLDEQAEAVQRYVAELAQASAGREVPVLVRGWSGEWNERDERNASIRLGLSLSPDWMLSVDHDEVVEERVDRDLLQKWMRNPDPLVTHYDVGWANHWDSSRLCRVDAPWSGNEYRSSMRGFRLWRVTHPSVQQVQAGNAIGLHCGNVPDAGENAKRVAALRFRHYGYMRHTDRLRKFKFYREKDTQPDSVLTQGRTSGGGNYDHLVREEGMQLTPWQGENGIGFTMLFHEREQLFDLHRHLDSLYALADHVVLVWTGPEGTAPSEDVQYVAARYGAEWVYHPLNDDLGSARNAGVDRLRALGCTWCLVMDPDEQYESTFLATIAMRRMAEVTDSWAWMFRFRNWRADGQWNWSENTRLFRLAGGILRFNFRVHETLERGMAELGRRGIHPQVRYAPFAVDHRGLAGGEDAMQAKLERYTRLLVQQLQDDPTSPGAWVSLGLQYGNDNRRDEQWACYEAAMACAGTGYLPFREAALYHLRAARLLVSEAARRLVPGHTLHQQVQGMDEWLREHAPDQPKLGAGRTAVPPEVDLQALLDAQLAALDTEGTGGHAVSEGAAD
jgi:GT2 family glycosyltransferase